LHALCDRLQPVHAADTLAPEQAAPLAAVCRVLWGQRSEILRITEEDTRQARARTDLLELAVLYAGLLVRSAGDDEVERGRAREQARVVLGEAESLLGPGVVLRRERAAYAETEQEPQDEPLATANSDAEPRSAWEHFALGRAALRDGDARAAIAHLDRSLALEPAALWPAFARGTAAFRLGQYDEALADFSACVALAPHSAPCAYNRGRAFLALGNIESARRDFARAILLDPTHEQARRMLRELVPALARAD
jgi:tetratricopeptide (TPR) repeat protein